MTPPLLRAALWMSGSITSFTAMAVAGRELAGLHDTFEIMAVRSAIGLVLVLGVGAALGRLGQISGQRLGGHLLRNVVHFTGQNLWFWAFGVLPLAQVVALEFTSPLWVVLLAPLILGERLTGLRLVAAGVGFAGILIVARPDMGHVSPGVLAAAGAALCFALTMLLTKALTKGETLITILFWLTLMQLVFGVGAVLIDGQVQMPTAQSLPWLVLIGVTGVLAHLCLTMALSLAPASEIVPLDFIRLPLIVVVGALFYAEPLDIRVVLGGGLILTAIWINLRVGRHD
ncbi:MAG: DMT family transporter [Bosea sp. (in: a-proteobacteria)]